MSMKSVKFLAGLSAMALSASMLLFGSINVQAATSGTERIEQIDVREYSGDIYVTPTLIDTISGTIDITYSVECDYITAFGAQIQLYPNQNPRFIPYFICPNVGTTGSASATYDFTYNGVNYSGYTLMFPTIDYATMHGEVDLLGPVAPISPEQAAEQQFTEEINNTITEIENAVKIPAVPDEDGTIPETIVEYECPGALNGRILETMTKVENVTLVYTFTYENIIFRTTITPEKAAEVFSNDISWYGPCYLANNFPTEIVGVAV